MVHQNEFDYIDNDEIVMLLYIDSNTGELLCKTGNQKLTNVGKVMKASTLSLQAIEYATAINSV